MARYRMRPIEVEAWLYTGDNADDLHKIFGRMKRNDLPANQIGVFAKDNGGYRTANVGDWIVRTADGDMTPMKPDIFAALYEENL